MDLHALLKTPLQIIDFHTRPGKVKGVGGLPLFFQMQLATKMFYLMKTHPLSAMLLSLVDLPYFV